MCGSDCACGSATEAVKGCACNGAGACGGGCMCGATARAAPRRAAQERVATITTALLLPGPLVAFIPTACPPPHPLSVPCWLLCRGCLLQRQLRCRLHVRQRLLVLREERGRKGERSAAEQSPPSVFCDGGGKRRGKEGRRPTLWAVQRPTLSVNSELRCRLW